MCVCVPQRLNEDAGWYFRVYVRGHLLGTRGWVPTHWVRGEPGGGLQLVRCGRATVAPCE